MELRRKRTAEVLSPEPELIRRNTSPNKASKTFSEVDEVSLIPASEALYFDNSSLLDPSLPPPPLQIICVLERLRVHYDLLKSTLSSLHSLSPSIQALTLTRDPTDIPLSSCDLIPGLPLHPAIPDPSTNYFGKLGVLHPLGGGQTALDAIVVVDGCQRRRLVLPFGWGAGRHVLDGAGGGLVRERLREELVKGVEGILREGGLGGGRAGDGEGDGQAMEM